MHISKAIDATIKVKLLADLKGSGFKKDGRTWHRQADKGIQIVNVQASSSNFAESGRFTVNLGIYIPEIESLINEGKEDVHKPKEHEATIGERLGVIAYGNDHWWDINNDTDIEALGIELAEVMRKFGITWLEKHNEIHAVVRALSESPSIRSVAACLVAGDRAEAIRRLKWAINDRPTATEHYSAWGRKLGLLK